MEKSKFARQCKTDGGYFKCCIAPWSLNPFEDSRNMLIQDGLIKAKKSYICKKSDQKINPCQYCTLDGICTKTNPMTGESIQHFYPKATPIPVGKIH